MSRVTHSGCRVGVDKSGRDNRATVFSCSFVVARRDGNEFLKGYDGTGRAPTDLKKKFCFCTLNCVMLRGKK